MQKHFGDLCLRIRAMAAPAAAIASCRRGATAIEYGLLAALIGIVLIGALVQLRAAMVGLPLQQVIDALAASQP